jgi:glycosyltransferase involved in cell wall biosynthesis
MNRKVSVILPVHNGAKYLGSAIESVLTQTYIDFELLVLNDHSTDESRLIALSFADRDKRVRVLDCTGGGLVNALNEGISLAKGEYIARMDADDICRPDRFSKQVAFLDKNPRVGIVGSCVRLIDPQGRVTGNYFYFRDDSDLRFAIQENCGSLFAHPTVMLRGDVFRTTALRYENFLHAEDYALWLKISTSWEMHNLRERLLDYRVHPQSVSIKNARVQAVNRVVARQSMPSVSEARLRLAERLRFMLARLRIKCLQIWTWFFE